MKKILLISGIVIVVAAGGYLLWRFVLAPAPTVVDEGAGTLPAGEEATFTEQEPQVITAARQKLLAISQMPVFDYWMDKNTGDIYYVNLAGEIYKNSSGQEEKVSSQTLSGIHSVQPAADGSKAMITLNYPFNTAITVFDASDNTFQPLPAGTISASWDPNSNNRIAYLKTNGNGTKSTISLMTLSTGKTSTVSRLYQKDLELEWAAPSALYLKQKPSSEYNSSIWSLDIKTKRFSLIINEESGLDVLWSPDGSTGLKFTSNGFSHSFDLIDNKNNLLANLGAATLPSKCVFDKSEIYCAISVEIPPRTKLPDDYLKRNILFADVLYKIDLATGEVELLIEPANTLVFLNVVIDVEHLTLRDNKLLFINRYDNKLYSLDIE